MRVAASLLLLFAFTSWIAPAFGESRSAGTVSPGNCVGKACLGDTRASVLKRLGPPSRTVSARQGLRVGVWDSGDCASFLFVAWKDGKVHEIHFNSPRFKSETGITAASSYESVVAAFPSGTTNEYTLFDTEKNRVDWEDLGSGITFSFAGDSGGPIVRVAIHRKGREKLIGYSKGDDWYWRPACLGSKRKG